MKAAVLFLAALTVAAALTVVAAQDRAAETAGKAERLYGAHCAACHGARGEGGRGNELATPKVARSSDSHLFQVIRNGLPGTEMPPSSAGILNDDDLRQVAAFLKTLYARNPTVARGNAARGEQLYRTRGDCARCHTVNGSGGALGPDLTEIGSRRGPAHLRTALLEPEAFIPDNFIQYRWFTVIPDNFLQVRVVTRAGRTVTGARVNEDSFSIQLRDAAGRVHSFWKTEIKTLHKDWGKSPMPSFQGVFSDAEIDDLVAWLLSLRGRE